MNKDKEAKKKVYLPSFVNIHKSLQILSGVIPQFFNENLVNKLFQKLQIKLSKTDLYESQPNDQPFLDSHQRHRQTLQMRKQLKYKLDKIPTKKSTKFMQSSKRRHSINIKNNKKYSMLSKRGKIEKQLININEELDYIWEEQHQAFLCDLYEQGKHFSQICESFQQKYHEDKDLFLISSLKGRFNKLIRTVYGKFKNHIKSNKDYLNFTINDTLARKIMYVKQARKIRERLIKIYRRSSWNISNIYALFNKIAQFQKEMHQMTSNNKKTL